MDRELDIFDFTCPIDIEDYSNISIDISDYTLPIDIKDYDN
jgi:hypothetical protein